MGKGTSRGADLSKQAAVVTQRKQSTGTSKGGHKLTW